MARNLIGPHYNWLPHVTSLIDESTVDYRRKKTLKEREKFYVSNTELLNSLSDQLFVEEHHLYEKRQPVKKQKAPAAAGADAQPPKKKKRMSTDQAEGVAL